MSNEPTYNVVTSGIIVEGFRRLDVEQDLVSVMNLKPEQAQQFLGKRRTVRKGVSKANANALCDKLKKLGIEAASELVVTESAAPLELVEETPAQAAKNSAMQCPSCGHGQDKSEQCVQCGIWFHKFGSTPDMSPTSAVAPSMSAAQHTQPATSDYVADTDVTSATSGLSMKAVLAAVGAAIVGAFIWKFVAVTFDYELGLIAWGIGGAIGFAAASLGSHGIKAGVVCSLLVVASIGLGKFWAFSAFVDEYKEIVSDVSEENSDLYDYYEEEKEDARLYANGSGSDRFVRQFMVDRNYTDASDPGRISEQEVIEFREYYEAGLYEMAERSLSFEEWKAQSMNAFDDISAWAMVRESVDWVDMLFLLFGIATAFRLSSQME